MRNVDICHLAYIIGLCLSKESMGKAKRMTGKVTFMMNKEQNSITERLAFMGLHEDIDVSL